MGTVAKRIQLEELPQILREVPKGGMGAHDFTARPLTLRFAAEAPMAIGSLILAVGLPQMF